MKTRRGKREERGKGHQPRLTLQSEDGKLMPGLKVPRGVVGGSWVSHRGLGKLHKGEGVGAVKSWAHLGQYVGQTDLGTGGSSRSLGKVRGGVAWGQG